MRLPTLADYQDAIQNPKTCFLATELKSALPECDRLGLPKAYSGNFAVVFPLLNSSRKLAIRCFATTYHSDQEHRYRNLSRFLNTNRMQCMVDFEFIPQGIKVKGQWFPILKMEWVDGLPLDKFVENNLNNRDVLINLADKFYAMIIELGRHGIAHGDLQHGNILVVNGQLKLVDYDCMFVPGLEGLRSNEIGHKNYQHPKRTANDFGPYIDNFSAWCIYLSLFALASEPSLWKLLDAGDENLLFKKNDMEVPNLSSAFKMLESMGDEEVRFLTAAFRQTLDVQDISSVPPLKLKKVKNDKSRWIIEEMAGKPGSETTSWTDWVPGFLPQPEPIVPLRPSLSEHALYKLLVLFGVYLSYNLLVSNGVDVSVAYAFSAGLPSALILSAIRFFKSSEYKSKKMKFFEVKKRKNEVSEAEKNYKRLSGKKEAHHSEHNKKVLSVESKQKSLHHKETTEVDNISGPMKIKIANLNTQIQQTNREEAEAINRALQSHVEDYINSKLSTHDLASVSIQGIGIELKRQLAANGIKTFGDILDVSVNYVQHGRFTDRIVQIKVRGRGNVKVHGIGPKKGETLLRYRKSLEQSYLNNAPKTLPAQVMESIQRPFLLKKSKLSSEEQVAQSILTQEVNKVRQIYAKQIEDCNKELRNLKLNAEKEFKELAWKTEQAGKDTKKKKFELEQIEKECRNFSQLKFRSYIRHLFTV
jgi:hypothetical protein